MKQGKSPGPDEMSTEMLLALEGVGIDLLFDIITKIYETGTFPAVMLKSVFVPLPKISGTLDCTNHRMISLMSHSLKVLLKIILQRIRRKLLPEISEAQYSFMKDRGTRNAIFNIRMLSEIKRGVPQGCIASPDLFNLYGESILRPLDEVPVGISINGVNIRYADDIILIATTEEGLQQRLDKLTAMANQKALVSTTRRPSAWSSRNLKHPRHAL